MKNNKIEIKLEKSPIGHKIGAKKILIALGLTKLNKIVVKNDSPHIRGMIKKVDFLVNVKEIKWISQI